MLHLRAFTHTAGSKTANGAKRRKSAKAETQAQAQRSKRRYLNRATKCLLYTELRENGLRQKKDGPPVARSKLTKPCAGLLVYLPSKGSYRIAATTKIASVVDAKGGWSLLLKLQKQHGYKPGSNDPSVATIMEHFLRELVGISHHQRPRQLSGKCCRDGAL